MSDIAEIVADITTPSSSKEIDKYAQEKIKIYTNIMHRLDTIGYISSEEHVKKIIVNILEEFNQLTEKLGGQRQVFNRF